MGELGQNKDCQCRELDKHEKERNICRDVDADPIGADDGCDLGWINRARTDRPATNSDRGWFAAGGLAGRCPFDEGTGTNNADVSGNVWAATSQGSPLPIWANGEDTVPVMVVNNGNPYTTSREITIQPSSTNYPNILVSLDPSMANATTLPNSGAITYTLPDKDGRHILHLQYADDCGSPHSPILSASVTLDRLPPVVVITSPASDAVLDQAFIKLQAVAADPDPVKPTGARPLKIWINGARYWDRFGTNIVVERFPVPAGTNSFTVHIVVMDQAGNSNEVSRTWTVDTSGDRIAPHLSSFNIATKTLLPDESEVWIEAAVNDQNAVVNAIVRSVAGASTNALNVRGTHVEGLVPLEFGTNAVVVSASDAAGNTSSNVFTIIRSDRYRFKITSPAFGEFATAPSNYVSGYVSAKFDEGLPTETNITSVFINGVAAVLGTNIDANGNLSFTTTNAIPLGVPITGFIAGPGIPTNPPPS